MSNRKRKKRLGELSNFLVGIPNSSRIEKKKEYQFLHQYNSIGLRNKPIQVKKNNNEFRIIALGDSFTEGLGAPQEKTWVSQLEKNLNKNNTSLNYNAINAGIAGSDPVFCYHLFTKKLLKYNPDLVLLTLNGTDANNIFTRGGFERYDKKGQLKLKKGPWWEFFYGSSFIVRFIVRDILNYNDYLVKEKGYERKLEDSFDTIYETILRFQELANNNNFQFKVVFMPFYQELNNGYMQLEPIYQYMSHQNSNIQNIYLPICYMNYIMANKKAPISLYWPLDTHHNSEGYELMAKCIEQELF